jgi:hypothetical protein
MSYKESMGSNRVFRLHAENILAGTSESKALQAIIGELDVWGTAEDGGVELSAPVEAGKTIASYGVNVTDVTDMHMEHFAWMEANWDSQVCDDESCGGDDQFYDTYQSHPNIVAKIQRIIDASGGHAQRYSWGQTTQNNDMSGIRIPKTGGGNEGAIFYFCGEHAREWLPPMFCVWLAEQLTTQAMAGDPEVTKILSVHDVYILPVMNVDGYTFSRNGNAMWRKSRKSNPGSTCIGTDLNRNYEYRWNNGGSSTNPCADTYHGQRPFDNPETLAMQRFYNSVDLVVQTDVHAYGQMWMHPWGWTYNLCPHDAQQNRNGGAVATAIRQVNGLTFRFGSIANVIYIASGSSCDDFYGSAGVIYAYAPEVRGSSFQPPASNIRPSNAELYAGFLAQVNNLE